MNSIVTLSGTVVLNLVILFVVKIVDNLISTSKTILIQKGMGILASLSVVISQIIFYELIDAVSNSGDKITIYIIACGSGIGTYIAIKISDKLSKEKTYINLILSDNKEAMMELRDFLRDHKITNLATDAYTKEWKKTIAITAYAETKDESRLLDKYLNGSQTKFKRVVTKE